MTEERSGGARPQPQKKGSGGGGPKPYLCFPEKNVVKKTDKGKFDIRILVGLTGKPLDHNVVLRFFLQEEMQQKHLKTCGGAEEEYVFEGVKPDLTKPVTIKVQQAGATASDSIILDKSVFKDAEKKDPSPMKAGPSSAMTKSFTTRVGRAQADGFNPVVIQTKDGKQGTFLVNAGQNLEIRTGSNKRQFSPGEVVKLISSHAGMLMFDARPMDRTDEIVIVHQETSDAENQLLSVN